MEDKYITTVLQSKQLDMLKELDVLFKQNNITYFLACGTALGAKRHNGFIPWDDDVDIYVFGSDYNKIKNVLYKSQGNLQFQDYETNHEYPYVFPKIVSKDTILIEESLSHLQYNCGVYIDVFPLFSVSDSTIIRNLTEIYRYILYAIHRLYFHSFQSRVRSIISKIIRVLFKPEKIQKKLLRMYTKPKRCTKYLVDSGVFWKHALLIRSDFDNAKLMKFEDSMFPVPANVEEYLKNYYGDYMRLPDEKERISGHHISRLYIKDIIDYVS